MATFVDDTDFYPLMVELLGCLCDEIKERKLPEPCRCELMPGDTPVVDFGAESPCGKGNGQAWVRLVGGGPSGDDFPAYGAGQRVTCESRLAWEFEVGISRNESGPTTVNNRPVPPSAESQRDAVRLYAADAAAMRAAITCCFAEKFDDVVQVALGVYTPAVSGGGAGGGTWRVVVRRG